MIFIDTGYDKKLPPTLPRLIGPRSASILANGLTKSLSAQRHHKIIRLLRMKDLPGNDLKEHGGKVKDYDDLKEIWRREIRSRGLKNNSGW